MTAPMTARRCEVRTPDGGWREIAGADLEPGMVYRLFEPDGSPVVDAETGATRFRALTAARDDPNGEVEAEPLPESEVEREVKRVGFWWPAGGPAGPGRLSPR